MTDNVECSDASAQLIREYCDLWSYSVSMNNEGLDDYALELLDLVDDLRQKWHAAETLANTNLVELEALKRSKAAFEAENQKLRSKFDGCQAELAALSVKHQNALSEIEEYRKRLRQVRTMLQNQQTDVDSIADVVSFAPPRQSVDFNDNDDIDFDSTAEDLDEPLERYSRLSKSAYNIPMATIDSATSSPVKEQYTVVEAATSSIVTPVSTRRPTEKVGSLAVRYPIRRSNSEASFAQVMDNDQFKTPTASPFTNSATMVKLPELSSPQTLQASWTGAHSIERRPHRVMRNIALWETCDVCHKRLGIGGQNSLKCLDCQVRFHRGCQALAPMPCLPRVLPIKRTDGMKPMINSMCAKSHPMIPPFLIHCFVALEKNRLNFEGIYRVPGSVNKVKQLSHDIITCRVPPSLENVETEVICGAVKRFFRIFRDFLIPTTSFDLFFKSIMKLDDEGVVAAYLDLPAPHRDTLAYVVLHLQRVAANSQNNKMTAEALALIFSPLLIGAALAFTDIKLTTDHSQAECIMSDCKKVILLYLLEMPSEFFNRFIQNNISRRMFENARHPGRHDALFAPVPRRVPSHYRICEHKDYHVDPLTTIVADTTTDVTTSTVAKSSMRPQPTVAFASPIIEPLVLNRRRPRVSELFTDPLL